MLSLAPTDAASSVEERENLQKTVRGGDPIVLNEPSSPALRSSPCRTPLTARGDIGSASPTFLAALSAVFHLARSARPGSLRHRSRSTSCPITRAVAPQYDHAGSKPSGARGSGRGQRRSSFRLRMAARIRPPAPTRRSFCCATTLEEAGPLSGPDTTTQCFLAASSAWRASSGDDRNTCCRPAAVGQCRRRAHPDAVTSCCCSRERRRRQWVAIGTPTSRHRRRRAGSPAVRRAQSSIGHPFASLGARHGTACSLRVWAASGWAQGPSFTHYFERSVLGAFPRCTMSSASRT